MENCRLYFVAKTTWNVHFQLSFLKNCLQGTEKYILFQHFIISLLYTLTDHTQSPINTQKTAQFIFDQSLLNVSQVCMDLIAY